MGRSQVEANKDEKKNEAHIQLSWPIKLGQ